MEVKVAVSVPATDSRTTKLAAAIATAHRISFFISATAMGCHHSTRLAAAWLSKYNATRTEPWTGLFGRQSGQLGVPGVPGVVTLILSASVTDQRSALEPYRSSPPRDRGFCS